MLTAAPFIAEVHWKRLRGPPEWRPKWWYCPTSEHHETMRTIRPQLWAILRKGFIKIKVVTSTVCLPYKSMYANPKPKQKEHKLEIASRSQCTCLEVRGDHPEMWLVPLRGRRSRVGVSFLGQQRCSISSPKDGDVGVTSWVSPGLFHFLSFPICVTVCKLKQSHDKDSDRSPVWRTRRLTEDAAHFPPHPELPGLGEKLLRVSRDEWPCMEDKALGFIKA